MILALDPGAVRMGWSVLDYGPKYVSSGILGMPRPVMGLDKKGKKIKQPFQEYKLDIEEYFAIEGAKLFERKLDFLVNEILPAVGGGNFVVATDSELAKTALTCMHVLATERDVAIQQMGATTIKKKVTGNPNATKVAVRNGVVKTFPELKSRIKDWTKIFDEPDAIATGIAYLI